MKIKLQTTNINIRIPKKLKNKFIEITEKKGMTYSMVIRNMIKNYVASDGNGELYKEINNTCVE